MEKNHLTKIIGSLFFIFTAVITPKVSAQKIPAQPTDEKTKSSFWQRVQFGGGLGLGFGSGYANVAVLPSAVYNVNQYVALGVGAQYSYLRQRDYYSSHLYGGSLIGLFNPIEEVQLSLELEQLRANVKADSNYFDVPSDNFWNTGLFLGAAYRIDNVSVGLRYNVLFQEDKGVYGDALMPFIRAYF